MKILVLGASGYIGKSLVAMLRALSFEIVCASRRRRATNDAHQQIYLDVQDKLMLEKALVGVDAVVNCVAGDADSIARGASALVDAALVSGMPRIIHLSTMAVYGRYEGVADEETPFDPGLGWYARAKCKAEAQMKRYAENKGAVVVLRPGCVYGPGSELWVGRVGRWLQSGRLGDLGAAGDGWSNLVHVDDVCAAIANSLSLALPSGGIRHFNLAAPDSPRWNVYFRDLARAIGATPVQRLSIRRVKLDALLFGPPLKLLEIFAKKAQLSTALISDPIPPALLTVFSKQILLDSSNAQSALNIIWKPYRSARSEFFSWFSETRD
jgi:nucleoside-diphosphate-sugar epimerase